MLGIKHLPKKINVIKLEDRLMLRTTIIPIRATPPLILFISPFYKENPRFPSAQKLSALISLIFIIAIKR